MEDIIYIHKEKKGIILMEKKTLKKHGNSIKHVFHSDSYSVNNVTVLPTQQLIKSTNSFASGLTLMIFN